LVWGLLRIPFCDKIEIANGGKNGTKDIGYKKQ
jgi:hypothetical protein